MGQLDALKVATRATHKKLVAELIKAGKYNWQALSGGDGAGSTCPSSPEGCTAFMKKYCDPSMQELPMMMGAGNADNQTIAAFLIMRPGTPEGLCKEERSGVYSRQWSNGKAVL